MKIPTSLWRKQRREEGPNHLLNSALDVALDFDNWLSPIQHRLKEQHPSLTKSELDALNRACSEAVVFGQQLALNLSGDVERSDVQDRFNTLFSEQFPWVSQDNLERAYRHCIYYATKTVRYH